MKKPRLRVHLDYAEVVGRDGESVRVPWTEVSGAENSVRFTRRQRERTRKLPEFVIVWNSRTIQTASKLALRAHLRELRTGRHDRIWVFPSRSGAESRSRGVFVLLWYVFLGMSGVFWFPKELASLVARLQSDTFQQLYWTRPLFVVLALLPIGIFATLLIVPLLQWLSERKRGPQVVGARTTPTEIRFTYDDGGEATRSWCELCRSEGRDETGRLRSEFAAFPYTHLPEDGGVWRLFMHAMAIHCGVRRERFNFQTFARRWGKFAVGCAVVAELIAVLIRADYARLTEESTAVSFGIVGLATLLAAAGLGIVPVLGARYSAANGRRRSGRRRNCFYKRAYAAIFGGR